MPPGSDGWREHRRWRRRGAWRWGPPLGGRRPPWWPEGEAWPPPPEAWREARRRFARRAALAAIVVMVTLGLVVAGLIWLVQTMLGATPVGFGGGLLFLLLPVLVVLLVAIWLVRGLRRVAAPVGELIEAAGRVEAGELGIQVAERGPREVRALARSFNAMSARLARTEEQRRTLLAEVSHELRTPLTVIAGTLEGMIDGVYPADRERLEQIRAETRQLERLIDDLRTLSLADAGALVLHREPADLAEIAKEAVAGFSARADAVGVLLTVRGVAPLELEVDPHRVHQVLANLLANALRHTPSGGEVSVEVGGSAATATVTVRDTGSGMTPDEVAHAFDRFWRSGESRGAGLGLAIVKDLVEAHGGNVEIRSEPGQGMSVTCTFPRVPPPG